MYWGKHNYSDFPWREETNQFHALIAEVLLQRTNAEQVVPVYHALKNRFPSPEILASITTDEIEEIIAPLGLKWRAKYLRALSEKLTELSGEIPSDVSHLKELPGIGSYSAAAYLSFHGGKKAPIIDANIVRFYGRFFGFDTGPETRRDKQLMDFANRVTPQRAFKKFNYALIDFTRVVCKPRPLHEHCPVSDRCSFYISNSGSESKMLSSK